MTVQHSRSVSPARCCRTPLRCAAASVLLAGGLSGALAVLAPLASSAPTAAAAATTVPKTTVSKTTVPKSTVPTSTITPPKATTTSPSGLTSTSISSAGVPGAPPTAGIEGQSTAADNPSQSTLRWLIWGLIGLAIVVAAMTVWLIRATRPIRDAPVGGTGGDLDNKELDDIDESGDDRVNDSGPRDGLVSPVDTGQLRRVPLWADEVGLPDGDDR